MSNMNKNASPMSDMSYVTADHVNALKAVMYNMNVTSTSCRINGEPSVAIVTSGQINESKVIVPIWVAITDNMQFEFPADEDWTFDLAHLETEAINAGATTNNN